MTAPPMPPPRLPPIRARVSRLRQDNRGAATAKTWGSERRGGDLIAFLDADDLWLPGKLERQCAYS